MTKTLRKPVTMLLALCMVFSLAVGACAAALTSSGGRAPRPGNLTATTAGIGGGEGGAGVGWPVAAGPAAYGPGYGVGRVVSRGVLGGCGFWWRLH